MTLPNSTSKGGPYAGAGSTGPFTVPFYFLQATDLLVTKRPISGSDVTLIYPGDYSVTGVGNPSGGSVTLTAVLAVGEKLTITRNVPLTQGVALPATGPLPSASMEAEFDKLTMICQQITERIGRIPTLSVSSTISGLTIDDPIANNLVGWNSSATRLENKGVSTNSLNVTTFFAAGNVSPSVAPSAVGLDALAVGNAAVANAVRALVLGKGYASGQDSVTINNNDSTSSFGAQASNSTVVGGLSNKVASTSSGSTIVGGGTNVISDSSGGLNVIVGGQTNTINGAAFRAAILGGDSNTLSGARAAVVGGLLNTASATGAAVIGGNNNVASSGAAVVLGGSSNQATAGNSTVVGGQSGQATQSSAAVIGGQSDIASGNNSAAIGGQSNIASGSAAGTFAGRFNTAAADDSATLGGSSNTVDITAIDSVIVGGLSNEISGIRGAILSGLGNLVTSDYGTASGFFNTVSGTYGFAKGNNALASRYGESAHAAGFFVAQGDAQISTLISRRITTNATPAELFLDNSALRIVLPNDSSYIFEISVIARRTDADNESAAYKFTGCIDRNANAASTALVGSVTKTVIAEDTAAWDVNVTADTTNGALIITVTGEAAKTIRWVAQSILTQVTG